MVGGRKALGFWRDQVLQELPVRESTFHRLNGENVEETLLFSFILKSCSHLQMSSTSSTMERRVSRVGCDGGGEKVEDVATAVSDLEDEAEVISSS